MIKQCDWWWMSMGMLYCVGQAALSNQNL